MNGVAIVKLRTPSDLARLVKNARSQRNLTQQEVADTVGITRQSIARLESGNGGASFDTVLRILDHLGIHLDATTDRRTAGPVALATGGSAQAAEEALANRITRQIDSGALDWLTRQTHVTLPQLDPAVLASIREASRGLIEHLTIPGAILSSPPRAAEGSNQPAEKARAATHPNVAGGSE